MPKVESVADESRPRRRGPRFDRLDDVARMSARSRQCRRTAVLGDGWGCTAASGREENLTSVRFHKSPDKRAGALLHGPLRSAVECCCLSAGSACPTGPTSDQPTVAPETMTAHAGRFHSAVRACRTDTRLGLDLSDRVAAVPAHSHRICIAYRHDMPIRYD